jgi:pimeloyl-ACP methyl ester carboxylesterase
MRAASHELTIRTSGPTFAGTLWVPGEGARATVLMHPGSGPSDRDNDVFFPPIREHLLGSGYAVCSFDKRGVGGSTGRWQDAGIVGQADDAIVQLGALLEDRRAPQPIGLFGHSQGGWVVLEAASRDARAAFVISSSGPGVSPAEQERYSLERALAADGATEAETATAVGTYDEVVALLRSNVTFAEARERLERLPDWKRFSFLVADEATWRFSAEIIDFDPGSALARIAVPILAVFGEADTVTPPAASAAVFERCASPELLTVKIIPHGDHRLQEGDPPHLVDGYLDELDAFLERAVSKGSDPNG